MDILNISTLSITEKPDTDIVDRLSSLPDHLISEILSNLYTDSAVATSILSRHWRYQWTNITRLDLTSDNISNCHELHAFLTTVDNILQKLSSPPSNLRTFDLNFNIPYTDIDHFDNAYGLCRTFFTPWFHRLCSSETERFEVSEQQYGSQPKLEHISISTSWDVLVLFRFEKIPIHLLTTSLMHWSFHGEDSDDVAILGLVKAISHSRSLHLCCPILNVMNSYELPTFHNLVDLSLVVSDAEDMNWVIPASILGKVKNINVREVEEYEKGMSLIEDILSKANVLEWLSVSVSDDVEEPMDSIIQKENDFVCLCSRGFLQPVKSSFMGNLYLHRLM